MYCQLEKKSGQEEVEKPAMAIGGGIRRLRVAKRQRVTQILQLWLRLLLASTGFHFTDIQKPKQIQMQTVA